MSPVVALALVASLAASCNRAVFNVIHNATEAPLHVTLRKHVVMADGRRGRCTAGWPLRQHKGLGSSADRSGWFELVPEQYSESACEAIFVIPPQRSAQVGLNLPCAESRRDHIAYPFHGGIEFLRLTGASGTVEWAGGQLVTGQFRRANRHTCVLTYP